MIEIKNFESIKLLLLCTVFVANGHKSVHIIRILHAKLGEIFDIHTNVSPLSNLQTIVDVLAEKISHLLVVKLQVRDSNKKPASLNSMIKLYL